MVVQNLQYIPGGGLLLLEPKTENSKRRIKLPIFVKDALKKHLVRRQVLSQSPEWKESGLLFTTNIGTPISPRNMVRHFKTKLSLLGLPEIRFQDLRHTVASILFEKGTHPKLVQELLGHSSIKVTLDRYSHLINPLNSVVADSLDDAISTA
jgi:integrase